MLIVVAIQTKQFPVTAIRRIIVVVVVFVMNCELPQVVAAKFAAATCAYLGVQFQRLRPVALLSLRALLPGHFNNPVPSPNVVSRFLR